MPRRRVRGTLVSGSVLLLLIASAGCASFLRFLPVEAPRFELVRERGSVLSLDPASVLTGRPQATVRIWTRVTNPNGFALTLSTFEGDLFVEGRDLAQLDLPLGLPMPAAGDTVIPLDVTFGLPSLATLGTLGEALLSGRGVEYRLDGTLGVDAGRLGQPSFGPRTWLTGDLEVRTGRR